MTPIMQFASTLAKFVRYVVPQLCNSQWLSFNTELATKLKPLHHHLSQGLIEPAKAGSCFNILVHKFLFDHPEFIDLKSLDKGNEPFQCRDPKFLNELRTGKNKLCR